MEIEDRLSGSVCRDQGSALLLSYFREDLKALRDDIRDMKNRSFDRFMSVARLLVALGTLAVITWKTIG
jgi:hypothetical protein